MPSSPPLHTAHPRIFGRHSRRPSSSLSTATSTRSDPCSAHMLMSSTPHLVIQKKAFWPATSYSIHTTTNTHSSTHSTPSTAPATSNRSGQSKGVNSRRTRPPHPLSFFVPPTSVASNLPEGRSPLMGPSSSPHNPSLSSIHLVWMLEKDRLIMASSLIPRLHHRVGILEHDPHRGEVRPACSKRCLML